MKTRRVFVTLEVETNASIADLRRKATWTFEDILTIGRFSEVKCLQVQANVARRLPKRKRAKRKA